MDAVFYQKMIAYELGEVAKAARYPRRPVDDLPPIDANYRVQLARQVTAADGLSSPTGWLMRFGRRLAASASIFSL